MTHGGGIATHREILILGIEMKMVGDEKGQHSSTTTLQDGVSCGLTSQFISPRRKRPRAVGYAGQA